MASYTYNGEQELVFPTLGVTVKKGDALEAPEDFTHPAFTAGKNKTTQNKPTEEVTE